LRKILLVLLLTFSFIFAQDPVAWYKLSSANYGNTVAGKFTDLSGNGNHGTPNATPTYTTDRTGQANSAMVFDGTSNYVNCGDDSATFNIGGTDKTIMAFIKLDVDNAGTPTHALFGKRGTGQFYFAFRQWSYLKWYTSNPPTAKDLYSVNNFYNNEYHLISLVYNSAGTEIKVYHNCRLQGIWDITGAPTGISLDDFYIGSYGSAVYFKGAIDEFALYNSALTTTQMETFFNKSMPNFCDWDFEQGVLTYDETSALRDELPLIYHENYWTSGNHAITIYNTGDGVTPYEGSYCSKHTCNSSENRAELSVRDNYIEGSTTVYYQREGQERWQSFYILVPTGFVYDQQFMITQFFERSHIDSHSPGLSIDITTDGKFRATATLWTYDSNGDIAHQHYYSNPARDISITQNQWYHIVYHTKTSTDSASAFFEGWVDGTPIFAESHDSTIVRRKLDRSNDTGYDYTYTVRDNKLIGRNLKVADYTGNEFRFGYYRHTGYSNTQSLYFDNIKVGKT